MLATVIKIGTPGKLSLLEQNAKVCMYGTCKPNEKYVFVFLVFFAFPKPKTKDVEYGLNSVGDLTCTWIHQKQLKKLLFFQGKMLH